MLERQQHPLHLQQCRLESMRCNLLISGTAPDKISALLCSLASSRSGALLTVAGLADARHGSCRGLRAGGAQAAGSPTAHQ